MVEVFASKSGTLVRVQTWTGDIVGGTEPTICSSFQITAEQAEKLIAQLQRAVIDLPRVGTPADLGCEAL